MGTFNTPPQPVYIYDAGRGMTFYFDGVIKVDHSVQLKIEDDPSNVKNGYVNSAKNEADEVTLDVVMSKVYTTKGDLPGRSGNRLQNSYMALVEMKGERRLVELITPIRTYGNMLVKSVSVTQDDSTTDGWTGTVVLHEAIGTVSSSSSTTSNNTSSSVDDGTQNGETPSFLASLFSRFSSKTKIKDSST